MIRRIFRIERASGSSSTDGQPVFIVHAAPVQGRQRLIYLDVETGLMRGYDEVQDLPGLGMVGCEVRVADYREIDGVPIVDPLDPRCGASRGSGSAAPSRIEAPR